MASLHVAVVGGGLVGITTALALGQQGYRVTLLDRQRPRAVQGALGLDIRNVALSPSSQSLLDEVGIWGGLAAAPYHRMCIWEQWGNSQVEFDAADAGRTELGWVVEMSALVCAGWNKLESTAGVDAVIDDISHVTPTDDGVTVHLAEQGEQTFDFLVAADGAQSVVRESLKLEVAQHPMDQVAVATVVQTELPHQNTAWQRFLEDGPLAFLPSPVANLCSVVWSQRASSAQRRMALSDDGFCTEIGHSLEHRLGQVTAVDTRFSFPLMQQRAADCAPHRRILLVGDAMRVVHPLAGLGVNLGLEDVQAILQVSAGPVELSAPGLWRRYARQRQIRSELMIRIMALLHKVYTDPSPEMSLLRNVGVRSFNALDGLKRQVMREAMGLKRL
jgi:ubiquinone biosynthesis UbiH/UbiF/VisC/COQ6 family hydroxylase